MSQRSPKTKTRSLLLLLLAGGAWLLLFGNAGGSAGSGFFALNHLFDALPLPFPLVGQIASWTFTVALFYGFSVVYGGAQLKALDNGGQWIHNIVEAYYQEKATKIGNFRSLSVLFSPSSWRTIRDQAAKVYQAMQMRQAYAKEAEQLNLNKKSTAKYLTGRSELESLKTYQMASTALDNTYKKDPKILLQTLRVRSLLRSLSSQGDQQEKAVYSQLETDLRQVQAEKKISLTNEDKKLPQFNRHFELLFNNLVAVRAIARDRVRAALYNSKGMLTDLTKLNYENEPYKAFKNTVLDYYFKNNPEYKALSETQFQNAWQAECQLMQQVIVFEQACQRSPLDAGNKARQQAYDIELKAEKAAVQFAKIIVARANQRIKITRFLRQARQSYDDSMHRGGWQMAFEWVAYPIGFLAACANGARSYFGVLAIAVALHAPPLWLAGSVIYGMLSGFSSSLSLTFPATVLAFSGIGRALDRGEVTLGSLLFSSPKWILNSIACLGSAAFIFMATLKVCAEAATVGLALSNPVSLGLAMGAAVFTFFAAFSLYRPHISTKPLHKLAKFVRRVVYNERHLGEREYSPKEKAWRTIGLILGGLATLAMGLIAKIGVASLLPMIATHVACIARLTPDMLLGVAITFAVVSAVVMGSFIAPAMYKQLGRQGREITHQAPKILTTEEVAEFLYSDGIVTETVGIELTVKKNNYDALLSASNSTKALSEPFDFINAREDSPLPECSS